MVGRVTREESMAEREVVLGLAAEIVSAHISNNAVPTDQLPGLIRQVFNTLASVEQASVTPPKPEPAVPIKQSMRADHLTCLDCGKQFSMLKRHLRTDHQLTPQEYRQRWDLQPTYPMVATDYAKTRSTLAKKFGLGRKGRTEQKMTGRTSGRGRATAK
jgi:predicted transcriptional regulator